MLQSDGRHARCTLSRQRPPAKLTEQAWPQTKRAKANLNCNTWLKWCSKCSAAEIVCTYSLPHWSTLSCNETPASASGVYQLSNTPTLACRFMGRSEASQQLLPRDSNDGMQRIPCGAHHICVRKVSMHGPQVNVRLPSSSVLAYGYCSRKKNAVQTWCNAKVHSAPGQP